MTDLRSWAKRWNDASMRQIAALRRPSPSRGWPLAGMFAIGLIAGAIASYAVAQRSQIKRIATNALAKRRAMLAEFGGTEGDKPGPGASRRSNHRRKAEVEVT
ncbi:MAG TPA: hypothetical protein VLK30_10675 [Candidatus Limnocylindrales bacterium]|nr:hypothetical protein [Candidatus Limnocylindrales bacterium]